MIKALLVAPDNTYFLSYFLNQATLIFKLKLVMGDEHRNFQYEITNQSWHQLQGIFDCKQDLINHLTHSQNLKINKVNGNITILGKHPTKKNQYVQLFILKMQQKQSENNVCILKQIINVCGSKQNITEEKLKRYLKQIVDKIQQQRAIQEANDNKIQRLMAKIQNIGIQIDGLKAKSSSFLTENQNIKQQTQQFRLRFNEIVKQKITKIGIMQNKVVQFDELIRQNLIQNKQKVNRLFQLLQNQQLLIKELQQKLKQQQIGQSRIIRHQKLQNFALIDENGKFSKHFHIKGNNITKQQDFIFPTMFVGAQKMMENPQFSIKIKKMGIIQKIYPGVCVGIVDQRHKKKQNCSDNDNVIQYSCAGKLFEKNKFVKNQGKGFEINDIVKLYVDFQNGIIQWSVNQRVTCQHKCQLLLLRDIDWRPYIFMRDKGDSVKWIYN